MFSALGALLRAGAGILPGEYRAHAREAMARGAVRNYDQLMHYRGRFTRETSSDLGAGTWAEDWVLRYHHVSRLTPRTRLTIAIALSLIVQVPPALFVVFYGGDFSWQAWSVLLLAFMGPLALLAARRFPAAVVVVLAVFAGLDFVFSSPVQGPPYLALAFAILGAIVHGARAWAWGAVGAAWAVTLVVGLLLTVDWHPVRVAISTLGILVVFGIGEAIRTRREHEAEFRRALTQRRLTEVQAERVRIARELHDVLAHSLSQINVQASVALHLMDKQPAQASEALKSIKATSKTALDEVRSVLGILRAEDGQDPSAPLVPEPDLARLPGLAASVTSQGVDVELASSVTQAPQSVQLAIYRIAQESLTNVVRHSGATWARVDLTATNEAYVLTVDDNGSGMNDRPSDGGRGLLGMRERAELLGGSLETGRSTLGGLRVTARIPVKGTTE